MYRILYTVVIYLFCLLFFFRKDRTAYGHFTAQLPYRFPLHTRRAVGNTTSLSRLGCGTRRSGSCGLGLGFWVWANSDVINECAF